MLLLFLLARLIWCLMRGISATLVNNEKVNSEVYDLQGRKVMNPAKGLYIVNGRKVIIK